MTTDRVDMVCGTSTGGLIALAISLGIPATKICDFYIEKGKEIFPPHRLKIPLLGYIDLFSLKQALFWGKYSGRGLRKSLSDIFEDKRIGDSRNLLCIPSYSVTKARPRVFKYDHREGRLSTDNSLLMRDVALATSAAPTYLPLAEIADLSKEQFVDGGVWANNPTLVGLLEALTCFVGKGKEYGSVQMLSISSLSMTEGRETGLRKRRSFMGWKSALFNTTLSGQAFFTEFFMNKIGEIGDVNIDYLRIPSDSLSREHESLIDLDVANEKAYNLMQIKAAYQAAIFEKQEKVIDFFTTPKTYII
ncbi:CBASS cGAMP-activated phospholipase [Parapedobacter koreensis]|nr:CBASS cGAMP-activated phospholipase [Parapedobacter koreensis]